MGWTKTLHLIHTCTLEYIHTEYIQIDIWLTWQRGKEERLVTLVPCGEGNVFGMLLAFIAPLKV